MKIKDKYVTGTIAALALCFIVIEAGMCVYAVIQPINSETAVYIDSVDDNFFTQYLFAPTEYKYPSAHPNLKVVCIDLERWIGNTIEGTLETKMVAVQAIYLMVISFKSQVMDIQRQVIKFNTPYCVEQNTTSPLMLSLPHYMRGVEVVFPYKYLLCFFYYDTGHIGEVTSEYGADWAWNPDASIRLTNITITGDA